MCIIPDAPEPPPPPAQRQSQKTPDRPKLGDNDPNKRRRRGYSALMAGSTAALQPPVTTASLGG